MSEKPSAAWYLAPIFLGIIGSAIMWYVLKDEIHPDSPKMIKKGWVIGIALTLIPLLMMIPMLLLIPMTAMNDFDEMEDHFGVIPEPTVRMVPAPGFEDATSSYMDKIIPTLDDFRNTLNESQDIETIFLKFGDPHRDIGSGIHIYVYELNDLTEIWIGYTDRILYVQHVDSDGNLLEQLFELKNET